MEFAGNDNHSFNHTVTVYRKVSIHLFILACFLLLMNPAISQQPSDEFTKLDRTMYRQFLTGNWDSLIITGKNGLKNKQDYFYLRLRLGVAYYNTGNYSKAISQLKRAQHFNPYDETAMEYLYYSYLYLNRENEARALSQKFPSKLADKLATKHFPFFDRFYVEGGPSFSNNIELNQRKSLAGPDSIYGEQDLNENKIYLHAGTELNLSKKISLYAGYSYLTIDKLKQIQAFDVTTSVFNAKSYPGGIYADTVYQRKADFYRYHYTLLQHEFYSNATFTSKNGIHFSPAFHLLNVNYSTIDATPVIENFKLQPVDTVPLFQTRYLISKRDTSFFNYVLSATLSKSISLFTLGLSASFSNLNNKNQYQVGGSVTFLPKGNLNLYTITNLTFAHESPDNRLVFDQLIGAKLFPKLWLEGFVTLGDRVNYNEKNAFVVYNSGDIIHFSAGANLIVPLGKHFEFSIRYRYYDQLGFLVRYHNEYTEAQTFAYQNNTFIGGIQWKL